MIRDSEMLQSPKRNSPRSNFSTRNLTALSSFAKLPNPASYFYSQLKLINGSDYNNLLNFIKLSLKIKSFGDMTDNVLLQSLLPYTAGMLVAKIEMALINNFTFDQFHKIVVRELIPSRLLTQVIQQRFYCLQAPNESLSDYVVAVKEATVILRLEKNESEAILEGLFSD